MPRQTPLTGQDVLKLFLNEHYLFMHMGFQKIVMGLIPFLFNSSNKNEQTIQCLLRALYIKFVYSEKTTKFCEISNLLLSTVHTDKSKAEISQNFVAFSEYINFKANGRPNKDLLVGNHSLTRYWVLPKYSKEVAVRERTSIRNQNCLCLTQAPLWQ